LYFYRAHINLGKTYVSLERFDDALRLFEQAALLSDHDPLAEGLAAQARALRGDHTGAQSILAALEAKEHTSYVAPISLAFANAGLGRLDATLANLKKAHRDRTIAGLFLRVDPNWEALHGNKDFEDLVKDLPDYDQEEGTDSEGK
jgi:tetratricopeptide (TPR) repeat protein